MIRYVVPVKQAAKPNAHVCSEAYSSHLLDSALKQSQDALVQVKAAVGEVVGPEVGARVGPEVFGEVVGPEMVGRVVGEAVGEVVGEVVGAKDGDAVCRSLRWHLVLAVVPASGWHAASFAMWSMSGILDNRKSVHFAWLCGPAALPSTAQAAFTLNCTS